MIIAMAHLLIFDALNLIRRLHAAIGKQPLPAESLLKATCQRVQQTVRGILDEVTPSHVIAVFDGESPSWRHELYPEYKAGRSPMPPELATGMETLQESLWHCGVDALLPEGDEADDLIATLNQQLFLHQQQVTLISTDKGFCQLLDTGIQIRDYFNRRWLDHAFVQQEYGLPAASLVDYWAITGIAGSNVRGVAGVGPKGAQQLLTRYGSLTAILEQAAPDDKLAAKVLAQRDEALLAQTLAGLRTDIPLGFNLKDIRYPSTAMPVR